MPKILGFRADAKHVYWAVVEGDQDTPVVVAKDKASAPVDLDEAWRRAESKVCRLRLPRS